MTNRNQKTFGQEVFANPSREQVQAASGDTTFQVDGNVVSRDEALTILDTKFKAECEANVALRQFGLPTP